MLFWTAFLFSGLASAVAPNVTLDYATYRGKDLGNGISQWSSIRYAAPPTGPLRFQAPADPPKAYGVVAADKPNTICLSVGGSAPSDTLSEDCLFLTVTAPTKATPSSKLPVYFYIQGGGFASNANPNPSTSGLVRASGGNIVVVNFNYRVGLFGFLAGQQVSQKGSVNNGLKDQRKALGWVKKYIAQFGGNPDHIVIGGDSAGGQSVALHLTAYGGRGNASFVGAIGQEVSTPYLLNTTSSQFIYDTVARRANCQGADSFACLSSLDSATLQKQNTGIPYPGAAGSPLFTYSPIVDFDLIPDITYDLFNTGKFYRVPTIMGDDENGGTNFAPKSSNSYSDCNTFLKNNFPLLSDAELSQIDKNYPIEDFPERFPNSGNFWRQTSQAYGDMRYKCPGLHFSSAINNASVASYAYRYAVVDPDQAAMGYGSPHTVETSAIFGPVVAPKTPVSYRAGGSNADIVPEIQAYWASFIRTLNPNTYKRAQDPVWGTWNSSERKFLHFVTNSTAMVVQSAQEKRRCEYYANIGPGLRQ